MEDRTRGRGTLKKCLVETLQNDMFEQSLSSILALDRATWKGIIHVANSKHL